MFSAEGGAGSSSGVCQDLWTACEKLLEAPDQWNRRDVSHDRRLQRTAGDVARP